MRRRTVCLLGVLVLAGLAVAALPGVAALDSTETGALEDDEFIQDCAAEPPDDFSDPEDGNEVIGWVDGYWYNEPLDIDVVDGLDEEQLEKLGARTAARFEAMRCLPAIDGVPPVEVQTREEFQDAQSELFADVSDAERQFDNAMFETMFLVDSEDDSVDAREENRGATVGGTYNFRTNEILIVTEDPDSLLIDEEILAHEIGHAIQDQHFNLSRYERPTTDVDKGKLGLIEGDVDLVEYQYLQACEQGLWDEPCVTQEFDDEAADDGDDLASWGLYFIEWQPYNDGPAFIQHLHEQDYHGDWSEVDAMYADPPRSALYSAFPGTYGDVELGDVEVSDRSNEEWERLTFEDSTDYDTLGVAGISAMFKAPTYEQGVDIMNPMEFLNVDETGTVDEFRPVDYAHPETEGWRDDKIYAYTSDENETGTVWKLEWSSPEDAEPFVDAYGRLATDAHDGDRVEDYAHTYTFEDNPRFDVALTVVPDGEHVTIVTAPSVEELPAVHDVDLVEADEVEDVGDDTPGDDADDTPDDDADDTPGEDDRDLDGTDDTDDDTADDDGAGFGLLVGAVAILLVSFVALGRR